MTKRLNSKHKVDRRLKANLGEDLRVHLIKEIIDPDNTAKVEKANFLITELSYKLNKN